jgi:hypothetical protein
MSVWTYWDEPMASVRQKIFERLTVALHVQEHDDDVDGR